MCDTLFNNAEINVIEFNDAEFKYILCPDCKDKNDDGRIIQYF